MKDELTHQESLDLIADMIRQAKRNVAKGGSNQILLWGWVISLANFGHYALAMSGYSQPYLVWLITIPAGIASGVIGMRMERSGSVGHIDRMYWKVWLAAAISMAITLSAMHKISFNHNGVILAIAGMGMFITGGLLKFKPIMVGSFVLWIAAIISFNLPEIQQYPVAGSAIILGYLIPGYLLKRAERG